MKIVLVIENDDTQTSEREFSQETIRIGRDPQNCEIVFEQTAFPMVSRRHAEINLTENKCLLVDLNSSYGTYLDGNRIQNSIEIKQNSVVQFGTNGAKVRVKYLEIAVPQQVNYSQPNQSQPLHQNQNAVAVLQSVAGNIAPFEIKKDAIRLGRATDNDLIIKSDDGVVSRNHAEIHRQNGDFAIVDNGSFNGTYVNEKRIVAQHPQTLSNGDAIQLGHGGPIFRFIAQNKSPQQNFAPAQSLQQEENGSPATLMGSTAFTDVKSAQNKTQPQLLMHVPFGGKTVLTIGRAADNDIRIDGLQISNRHAQINKNGGTINIEDLNSTNGVFIAGEKITTRRTLTQSEILQIGPFQLCLDKNFQNPAVLVFDTRSKTRIDAVHVTKEVKNRSGGGTIKLLDDISLTIQPNEFVGLLGPSGAGKSTLMDALNGMRPASAGNILINNLDLFANLDALKQSIGYVPQDDIIHRELTVYRTLYYIAKLRLSGDVSGAEIEQIISEVLDVTGLVERRDVLISQLSGGQRKRVSIAVELITKPSVIFLDEPTSGLDPATEDKIMKLFRRIAESGRTVILTTHAMENVALFDKIVVLMRGKLVFYGAPQEALKHLVAKSFKELYDKLEAPIETRL
ncbi:MAG: FHA domain-containing protein, partial [Pyrinomonadaceae bacterium]|nr:FHA domain-containing protein [Pyrinomonadaceae bacterium]